MKIGITGGQGFIGWHLQCYLKTLENIEEVRIADRNVFSTPSQLKSFTNNLDCIVHLAGVNRAEEKDLLNKNIQLAQQLVSSLIENNNKVCIIYGSSTYAEAADNAYGKGKAEAGAILKSWAEHTKNRLINLIIPHVYGEYGRPFYNSVVATFCHQMINGDTIQVNSTGQLELIHVQDLVEIIMQAFKNKTTGNLRITGEKISVKDLANRLRRLYDEYIIQQRIPDLNQNIDRNLFNTLRGAITNASRIINAQKHSDERGWLVETIKAGSGGQCFVSTTQQGITRGNHFHRRKVERFFVLQGKARIELRKLLSNEVISYHINGEKPAYIDIPTLHTHSITNIGENELITLFWVDEYYDPENPDTFYEKVSIDESERVKND